MFNLVPIFYPTTVNSNKGLHEVGKGSWKNRAVVKHRVWLESSYWSWKHSRTCLWTVLIPSDRPTFYMSVHTWFWTNFNWSSQRQLSFLTSRVSFFPILFRTFQLKVSGYMYHDKWYFSKKVKDLGWPTKTSVWSLLSFNSFWPWWTSLFNIPSWFWKSISRTEKISRLFHPGRFSNWYQSLIWQKALLTDSTLGW